MISLFCILFLTYRAPWGSFHLFYMPVIKGRWTMLLLDSTEICLLRIAEASGSRFLMTKYLK